jgi:hypothetical protein
LEFANHRGRYTRERAHRAFGRSPHVFPGTRLGRIDIDGEEHLAVIDGNGREHIGIGERNPARRFHLCEGIENLLLRHAQSASPSDLSLGDR